MEVYPIGGPAGPPGPPGIPGAAQTGVVPPEGVVTAAVGEFYWDTNAKALWIKETGAGNTGWYQLIG